MTSATKLLFLEIDAGDKLVLQKGASEGWLPNYRSLLERGLVGDTLAPEEFYVGGIWPTLYTGVDPATHGIHSLVQLKTGTYDFYRCRPGEHIKRQPFWTHLSNDGKRIAILDIPLSGITEGINGIQSVEWGSHDESYGFRAWPKEFEEDVLSRFGRHPMNISCNQHGTQAEDFLGLRDKLIEGVKKKSELTKHYLRKGGWDFFAQVFTESHCIGHQCWHLHDPDSPGHDLELAARVGDPLKEVYKSIDAALGEVIQEAGDEATVIVLAGHRMAQKCGAQFLLPDILVKLGVAKKKHEALKSRAVRSADEFLTWCWQRVPSRIRTRLSFIRRSLRTAIDGVLVTPEFPTHLSALDLRQSACFLMDNGFPITGLRLNVAGREPAGWICNGVEMDRFCEHLTKDLLDLRYADCGEAVVRSVKRISRLYQGEYLEDLPDLVVEWSDTVALGSSTCGNPARSLVRVQSDKIGIVEGVNTYIRTGDHRPQGMFVAVGPNIRAGKLDHTISIMDIAPTICALLGTELTGHQGTPIREIVERADPTA